MCLHRSFMPILNKCILWVSHFPDSCSFSFTKKSPHSWSKRSHSGISYRHERKKEVKIIYKWLMIKSNKNIDRHSRRVWKSFEQKLIWIFKIPVCMFISFHFMPLVLALGYHHLFRGSSFLSSFLAESTYFIFEFERKMSCCVPLLEREKTPNSRQQQNIKRTVFCWDTVLHRAAKKEN